MDIRRLTSHAVAEAVGIDLTQPVSAEAKATINRAFVEHSVLVVRDQALTPAQVLTAVELFGPVFHQHNTKFALAAWFSACHPRVLPHSLSSAPVDNVAACCMRLIIG